MSRWLSMTSTAVDGEVPFCCASKNHAFYLNIVLGLVSRTRLLQANWKRMRGIRGPLPFHNTWSAGVTCQSALVDRGRIAACRDRVCSVLEILPTSSVPTSSPAATSEPAAASETSEPCENEKKEKNMSGPLFLLACPPRRS